MAADPKKGSDEKLQQIQIADLQKLAALSGHKVSFAKNKPKEQEPTEDSLEQKDQKHQRLSSTALLYFYHPDHLGTSTFLTDYNGNAYQFFLNLPFGETMAEQKSITEDYETPYKFNGKELDEETGLYYYGARYYDPKISIWLSVDPMVEETMDAYGYCYQNPINLVDPDGLSATDPTEYKNSEGRTILNTKDGSNDVITIPDEMINDFRNFNASNINTIMRGDKFNIFNSSDWNNNMKATILGFETLSDMDNTLGGFTTQWSRQNAINYLQNPTIENAVAMAYSEALSQWTDPEKLIMGASILVGGIGPKPKGLGNQFKTQTLEKAEKAFEKHVKSGKLIKKPSAPGNSAYQNTNSRYSYNLDPGSIGKKGRKEAPHIDVNYPNPKPKNVPNKKKLPTKS